MPGPTLELKLQQKKREWSGKQKRRQEGRATTFGLPKKFQFHLLVFYRQERSVLSKMQLVIERVALETSEEPILKRLLARNMLIQKRYNLKYKRGSKKHSFTRFKLLGDSTAPRRHTRPRLSSFRDLNGREKDERRQKTGGTYGRNRDLHFIG